jgi:hypothetical protein
MACRQIRTDGAPIKTAMPTYPSGCALVPRWVCPCTQSGTSSCPLGYARVPSWVQPRTHTGTPVYQFGYALVPTRVRPCTKSGTTSYPNGFASAPSRVRPRTRMGMPMYRVGYALVLVWVSARIHPISGPTKTTTSPKPPVLPAPQACPRPKTARFSDKSSLLSSFPWVYTPMEPFRRGRTSV